MASGINPARSFNWRKVPTLRLLLCTPLFEHEHEDDSVLLRDLTFFLNGFRSGSYQHRFGFAGGKDAS
jgi:hypothetical protein